MKEKRIAQETSGLPRERVHKLLDEMTDEQVKELISYLFWILETPYNS